MVARTCCVCYRETPDLRHPKCCNGFVCGPCAENWKGNYCRYCQSVVDSWDIQTVARFYVVLCISLFVLLGLTVMIAVSFRPDVEDKTTCKSFKECAYLMGTPGEPLRDPQGLPGPPGEPLRGPQGVKGPEGICVACAVERPREELKE